MTETAPEPAPDIGRAQLEKMLEQLERELRNYEQAAMMTTGAINTLKHMLRPQAAPSTPVPAAALPAAALPATDRTQRRAERKKRAA